MGTPSAERELTLERLATRGTLRVAVIEGSMAYFLHRGEARGFEYELLARFAARHGAELEPMLAFSAKEAAALVRSGSADVALLPWTEETQIDGATRVEPYLTRVGGQARSPSYPETGAPFVREDSPQLRQSLDVFLASSAATGDCQQLFQRYFVDNRGFNAVRIGGKWVPTPPRISSFDALIAKHAAEAGLDWRLVASLIFEESSFNPRAVSIKGARGLMQVMPTTAQEIGFASIHKPDDNIRAGVAYLTRLSQMFAPNDGEDHLRTIVAAYLLGPGPILDAKRIALATGRDPNRWSGGLDEALPLLEDPKWADRVRFSGARGSLAVGYVNRIFRRFAHYRQHIGDAPAETAAVIRRGPSRAG